MASTNIDRSLDEIIKDQKKAKRKLQKLKAEQTKKNRASQQQGKRKVKGTASDQNQRRRITRKQNTQSMQQGRGTQGRRATVTGKQRKMVPQGRGTQNNNKKQNAGNTIRGRTGRAMVTANRLKNKQGSLQKTKKVISKAKQIQQNRQRINRQNRQTQQKDARQNIVNLRRRVQGLPKGNRASKAQNMSNINLSSKNSGVSKPQRMNRLNRASPQWKQATNAMSKPNWRRWGGGVKASGSMDSGDNLRISVPNNLFRPATTFEPLRSSYEPSVDNSARGMKRFATLDERFSMIHPQKGVRTIVVD